MSLEALLSVDSITVRRRPRPASAGQQDASGGIAVGGYQDLYTGVPARIEDMSASQTMPYALRGMLVDSTIYTQQTGIAEMDLIITSDGRKKLVEGVKYYRAIGNMPDYYAVICSEYRPGA